MASKLNLACEMLETELYRMIFKVNGWGYPVKMHMHKNVQVISGF